jgi:hypothetical protein
MYFVLKTSIIGIYKMTKQAIALFIHRITREARIKARIAEMLRNREAEAERARKYFEEIKRLMELGHNPDGSESSIEPEKIVTLDDIDPVQV